MNVRVKVKTNAKKDSLTVGEKNTLSISVRVKPQENRANERVIQLVARHFGVPAKQVRIVSGHQRPSKMLRIDGEGA